MRYIIILLAFLPFASFGQITKGSGVTYHMGTPVSSVDTLYDSELAIDWTTGYWWEYSRDSASWIPAGYRIQVSDTCLAPTHTPQDKQSLLLINACDSLYYYHDAIWWHINKGDGNGIYGGSDTVPSGTVATLLKDFSFEGIHDTASWRVTTGDLFQSGIASLPDSFRVYSTDVSGTLALSISPNAIILRDGATEMLYADGNTNRIGINTDTPNRQLEVAGEVRITDLVTDQATVLVGADADGDLSSLKLSGLTISNDTLIATGGSLQTLSVSPGAGGAENIILSGNPDTVILAPGSGVTISSIGNEITISSFEVDGSTTNEGSLDVDPAGSNSAAITSNTSGSPQVHIAGLSGMTVTETADTIYLESTATATPAGSDTQVQFNDGGVFGADTSFTWNKTTNVLTLGINGGTGTFAIKDTSTTTPFITVDGNRWFHTMGTASNVEESFFIGRGAGPAGPLSGTVSRANIGIGLQALDAMSTGADYNLAIGINALGSLTSSDNNIAIGYGAISGVTTSGGNNVGIGNYALRSATIGDNNIGILGNAGTTYSGYRSIQIGSGMNSSTSADDDIGIGWGSNNSLTSGDRNIAIGYFSLAANTASSYNTAVGYRSLTSYNGTSGSNSAFGNQSLFLSATGRDNTGIGNNAGYSNDGSYGIFLGSNAGFNELNSYRLYIESSNSATPLIGGHFDNNRVGINTHIDSIARTLHVGGEVRITDLVTDPATFIVGADGDGDLSRLKLSGLAISNDTLIASVSGPAGSNTQVQFNDGGVFGADTSFTWNKTTNVLTLGITDDVGQIMFSDTTTDQVVMKMGIYDLLHFSDNSAKANPRDWNMFFGVGSGNTTLTSTDNMAFGNRSLYSLTTGFANTTLGQEAMPICTTGSRNVAIGNRALESLRSGSNNFALGYNTLRSLTTGGQNISIGFEASGGITTGVNNVHIGGSGFNHYAATPNISRTITLGPGARARADKQMVIGDANTSAILEMWFGDPEGANGLSGYGNNSTVDIRVMGIDTFNTNWPADGTVGGFGGKLAYLRLVGPNGTGTGYGGPLYFATCLPGASGNAKNPPTNIMTISGVDGDITTTSLANAQVIVGATSGTGKFFVKGADTLSSTYTAIFTNSTGSTTTPTMALSDNKKVGIGTNSPGVSLDVGAFTDGIELPNGTTAQRTSNDNTIRVNTDMDGLEVRHNTQWHRITTKSVPGVAADTAAGTTPIISINGNDLGFYVTLNVDTDATDGDLFTVTYGNAFDALCTCTPTFSPANKDTAGTGLYVSKWDNTSMTIGTNSALNSSLQYKINVHIRE